jgi:predicted nucleotidyltransferase component of viral defense system
MQNLIKQEQFEIEVLDRLNSRRLLEPMVFAGGTMLRLCYGLNRFSVDLDFWIIKKVYPNTFFNKIKDCLGERYKLKDAANKFHTFLFEISSPGYPRSLKLEIRKEKKKIQFEESIAYSPYSDIQVILKTVPLSAMMGYKIEAFLDRNEIRDCFDIEFLYKKGIDLPSSKDLLINIISQIDSLKEIDYRVKLGSLILEKERVYYKKNNFKLLKSGLEDKLRTIRD